jgi:hypothetical protein
MSSFAMSGQITIVRPPNFIHKAEFQDGEVGFALQNSFVLFARRQEPYNLWLSNQSELRRMRDSRWLAQTCNDQLVAESTSGATAPKRKIL